MCQTAFFCVACCFCICALPGNLRADWLELTDGSKLRGIDYKPGKPAFFTVETGHVISLEASRVVALKVSPKDETIEFRGKQVTLREMIGMLQRERKARLQAASEDLRSWARGAAAAKSEEDLPGAARDARDRLLALDADELETALAAVLRSAAPKETRRFAAALLAKHNGARPTSALLQAALRDEDKTVRETAFTSLKLVNEPSTGERIIPFLSSQSREERARAAAALETFPTRRAVPALIFQLQKVWDDFGRGYTFVGEERAFIRDYNLVSGGTGFAITEVADPEVSSVKTGVLLEVKVRKVEMTSYARALRSITGEDLGVDARAWRKWWREKGREAATK